MDWPNGKLQVCKFVSIEFAPQIEKKKLHLQMIKSFHICKWINFAISTFVIIEEMTSAAVCLIFFCLLDFLTYFD